LLQIQQAGTPQVIDTEAAFQEALATLLSQGSGPFAVDAERASGLRYSARAYLIQIKRKRWWAAFN
jgi:ribonuclease D